MWIHNLNPTLLSLGPLEIRWYGLAYVLGFFISVWWLHYLSKKGKLKLESDQIWDLMFYLMIGVLIGARVFEIFWEPQLYFSNFFQKPANAFYCCIEMKRADGFPSAQNLLILNL